MVGRRACFGSKIRLFMSVFLSSRPRGCLRLNSVTVTFIAFVLFLYGVHLVLLGRGPFQTNIIGSDFRLNMSRKGKLTLNWHNNKFESIAPTHSKILCYILLARKRVPSAVRITETWGSRCDKLVFYGNFKSPILNVTFLNATEGYAYLWGKTKAAILHLQRVYSKKYDWFIKADDDTFLIVENLRRFVSNISSNKPVWFGYKLRDKKMKQGYMSGGAGYVFSKTGLQRISSLLQTQRTLPSSSCNIEGQKGYEDLELGKCCISARIKEVDTTDSDGREKFLPLPLSSLLNSDVSRYHWIWKQAWNPINLGDKCCSPELISMHKISPNQMKLIYYLIYKVNKK